MKAEDATVDIPMLSRRRHFDLVGFILTIRPDLHTHLELNNYQGLERFLYWLLTCGTKEYPALFVDGSFRERLSQRGFGSTGEMSLLQYLIWLHRPDVQEAFAFPSQFQKFLTWFYTHGVEECGYGRFLGRDDADHLQKLSPAWKNRVLPLLSIPNRLRTSGARDPWGVNVIGYAFGQLGIGEDARMATQALLTAGIPTAMINFPPGKDIPQNDMTMCAHVSATPRFRINIFCLTAEETGRFYAERGNEVFANRYNIGYWPWELSKWPREWEGLIDLVDEIWVSSQHTFEAISSVCEKPVRLMPMAVDVGKADTCASRNEVRAKYGLPQNATLFCFSFDLNSSMYRKNPGACVEAFTEAFPLSRFSSADVGMVIKVHKPKQELAEWTELKALAKRDPRIHIVEGTLSRAELIGLYRSCDSFVSLHRAEGFGRGIAEALQLGLYVIATGYSGNVDFCKGADSALVEYSLVTVPSGQYPRSEGQVWANPDTRHAAKLMQAFHGKSRRKRVRSRPEFSFSRVGGRYATRLTEIEEYLSNADQRSDSKAMAIST